MDNLIIESWNKNADEWVKILDAQKIESRAYTNQAILEVLSNLPGTKIVDMGCGEGWLCRSLTKRGKKAIGIDAVEVLLGVARSRGTQAFYNLSFEQISRGAQIPQAPFDSAVFNFSLYQKEKLEDLLQQVKKHLRKSGNIVIQTLHPYFLLENGLPYKSQLIADSWMGLPGNFSEGHSWYARTIDDWVGIAANSKLKLIDLKETLNQENKPVSLILRLSSL
ncbi:MAG: class I SAM-dependent methyltransferase [Flavobacteriaceae bacterium]